MTKLTKHATRTLALVAVAATLTMLPSMGALAAPGNGNGHGDNDGDGHGHHNNFVGAVFAMTNATAGNRIVRYGRSTDGRLTRLRSVSTGGLGIGVDTDTQGPLRLARNNQFLYAVNPGSDNISVFRVNGTSLQLIQVVDAGDQPMSLTISGDLLYSMDASVAGNGIRGFRITQYGKLIPMANSFRALSSPIAVPGDIEFTPDGRTIVVTEKTTNTVLTPHNAIDVFRIDAYGYASAPQMRDASVGTRPFSVTFRSNGKAAVAESFNAAPGLSAASSYDLNADGSLSVISSSVPSKGTDACWIILSKDQNYAYVSNFGSGTISSYSFTPSGALTLINGSAASFGATSQPVDSALSGDGKYLYQLLRGAGAVGALRVQNDGSLTPVELTPGGLPVNDGASGLAAY